MHKTSSIIARSVSSSVSKSSDRNLDTAVDVVLRDKLSKVNGLNLTKSAMKVRRVLNVQF